jgi:Na+-translocating ferredoxin:NAD+ oxidoreductase subunit B
MKMDVYEKLRAVLDVFPTGFPKTEDGIEIRYLKKFFSEKEAEVAATLPVTGYSMPKNCKTISDEIGKDADEVRIMLASMEKRGLIIGMDIGESRAYSIFPFAPGMADFTCQYYDEEAAELYEKYHWEVQSHEWVKAKLPIFKIIPINATVPAESSLYPYEVVVGIINDSKKLCLSECLCRTEKKLVGKGCDRPTETCILLNDFAEQAIRIGKGREISKQEAIDLVGRMEDMGCFHTMLNSKISGGICNCCPCCCDAAQLLAVTHSHKAFAKSNFMPVIDEDICIGCADCVEKCYWDAISIENECAVIEYEQCAGCGRCVRACEEGALSMKRKKEEEMEPTPENAVELFNQMGWRNT